MTKNVTTNVKACHKVPDFEAFETATSGSIVIYRHNDTPTLLDYFQSRYHDQIENFLYIFIFFFTNN